jgi:hypothetical protein
VPTNTKPTLVPITPIDALLEQRFNFQYQGNIQIVKNNLIIETIEGVEVYNSTMNNFSFFHTLPPLTLTNGNRYKAKLRVGTLVDQWSEFSNYITFWALELPTLTILTIDYDNQNRVYSQNVNFQTDYSHPNGEILRSYRYLVYDTGGNLIQTFPERFSNGSTPLEELISGLMNNDRYYVEVRIETQNAQTHTTGQVVFFPYFDTPRLGTQLEAIPETEQGAIRLRTDIQQLFFHLYDNDDNEILEPEFVDGSKIDMNRADYNRLVAANGFIIPEGNYKIQFWAENLPERETLVELWGMDGTVKIEYYDERFHAFKQTHNSNIINHTVSEELVGYDGIGTVSFGLSNTQKDLVVWAEVVI